jgi:hypothetical protein
VELTKTPVQITLISLVVVSLLAGCGGDSHTAAAQAFEPPVVQGTAAVGSPITGAALTLKCKSGEGTTGATTDDTGRYKLSAAGLEFPCVLTARGGKINGIDNTQEFSSALSSAGVANLTPWTHLVMAQLLKDGHPHSMVANMSPTALGEKVTPTGLSEATTAVGAELVKFLGSPPPSEIDPLTTAFDAQPENGMDAYLRSIMSGLKNNQKTLDEAAQDIATGGLKNVTVKECRPAVLTNFTGGFNDVPVFVPLDVNAPSGNPALDISMGGAAGAGGGDGVGVGGSLGQFKNATIRVERSDGSLIGEALTDSQKGMVAVVTCDYKGPLHLTVKAKPDGSSTYFDERVGSAGGINAKFDAGQEMHAVALSADKNIGITLLTEAAWQYLDAKHGKEGWKTPANVSEANKLIRDEFNKFLPKALQVDDITRLPFLVSDSTQPNTLGTSSPNDIYGIVSSGLASAASLMRDKGDMAPALKLVRQLGRDLCDGVIDLACKGKPVVDNAADAAYLPPQFGETLNRGVGDIAARFGKEEVKGAAFQVTQMALDFNSELWYGDQEPIYLLGSGGQLFAWERREFQPKRSLPDTLFNRLFPQTPYSIAGLTSAGKFVAQMPYDYVRIPSEEFDGATTMAGYGYDHKNALIARMPDGRAKYFPDHSGSVLPNNETGYAKQLLRNDGSPLDNITAVGISVGGDDQGVVSWAWSASRTVPTIYAVTKEGKAYAMGNDRLGALGDGKPLNTVAPTMPTNTAAQEVVGLSNVTSIVGRESGAFALDSSGRVWGWGALDDMATHKKAQSLLFKDGAQGISTPVLVEQLNALGPIAQINCGWSRTCAVLTRQGEMWVWGMFRNLRYNLPQGVNPEERYFPVTKIAVPEGRRMTYIGASMFSVYGLLDDGQLVLFPSFPVKTCIQFIDTKNLLTTAGLDLPAPSRAWRPETNSCQ